MRAGVATIVRSTVTIRAVGIAAARDSLKAMTARAS
jgi:hypothetical protein